MEKAIVQMLGSQDLTQQFYAYPLIANLYQRPKRPGRKARLPSYIPAGKFSATLFELIIRMGKDNSPIEKMTYEIENHLVSIESPEQQKLARQDWEAISETARNVAGSGLGIAALDSLKFQVQAFGEKYPELKTTVDSLVPQLDTYYGQFVEEQPALSKSGTNTGSGIRQFRLGVSALRVTNPRLNETVTAIVKQTEIYSPPEEQALAMTRVNLESWFNDAMDRLSGAYKRRAQSIAFVIGLILALLLNVDTINVANKLWREPTLRQAIIAQAENYVPPAGSLAASPTGPLDNIPALEKQLQALNIPFGWTIAPFNTGGSLCTLLPIQSGQVMGIPSLNNQGQPVCNGIRNFPIDLNGWLLKGLGLLITGLAAAQGAPFWFDILKKIINVRGTGTNPVEQKPAG